jgi:hypothetical protein
MPILENQPRKAFERFENHIVGVVNEVLDLPRGTVLRLQWSGDAGTLGFTRGGVTTAVPLETNIGALYLHLAQDLTAIPEGFRFRLRTKRYAYKLFPSDDPRADAMIRWEFDAETGDDKECRNHLHLNMAHPGPLGRIDFNRLHVPTAWVLIEHVLRFLFHDLQVAAKTPTWPAVLRASETTFYEKFTGKRYRWRG